MWRRGPHLDASKKETSLHAGNHLRACMEKQPETGQPPSSTFPHEPLEPHTAVSAAFHIATTIFGLIVTLGRRSGQPG